MISLKKPIEHAVKFIKRKVRRSRWEGQRVGKWEWGVSGKGWVRGRPPPVTMHYMHGGQLSSLTNKQKRETSITEWFLHHLCRQACSSHHQTVIWICFWLKYDFTVSDCFWLKYDFTSKQIHAKVFPYLRQSQCEVQMLVSRWKKSDFTSEQIHMTGFLNLRQLVSHSLTMRAF